MIISRKDNDVIIKGLKHFSITHTLECGQCFNFEKIGEEEYVVVAYGHLLHVKQNEDMLTLYDTTDEDVNIWMDYFDFSTDYGAIKERLILSSSHMKEAVDDKYGVHILNQEFSEMLISFIISQNNRIPQIKKSIKSLSEEYGVKLGNINGKDYYSFPTIEVLNKIGEEGFRKHKTGFRAAYLVEASRVLSEGLSKELFCEMEYDKAIKRLCEIKGVGDKVANCVALFALGYRNAFPVDVWVKRVMQELYFEGVDTDKQIIARKAEELFGEYGGYAQQYLFYHRRDMDKIGNNTKTKEKTR